MTSPISSFTISPSYSDGFLFSWEVAGDFNDPAPWTFEILEGQSPDGPWTPISPKVSGAYSWKEPSRTPAGKANVLYFRVAMSTSRGRYESPSIQPYGTLSCKEFLIAREVMRQSVIHSRGMAGTMCKVYILSTFGPKCAKCLDPITGMVRNSHCDACFGTGRAPAYHGPYEMWLDFSEDSQHRPDSDKNGTTEKKSFQAKAVGNPVLKHGDIVVVPSSDKRYYVDTAAMTSEIRRIPVVQTLMLEEAALTDKIYQVK